MKSTYKIFAACILALFCYMEFKGVSWDNNETSPHPVIYSRRGGTSGAGVIWFSSK